MLLVHVFYPMADQAWQFLLGVIMDSPPLGNADISNDVLFELGFNRWRYHHEDYLYHVPFHAPHKNRIPHVYTKNKKDSRIDWTKMQHFIYVRRRHGPIARSESAKKKDRRLIILGGIKMRPKNHSTNFLWEMAHKGGR